MAVSNGLSAIHWAQRHHLLPDSKNCPHCGRGMNLADRGTGPEGLGGVALEKGVKRSYLCVSEHSLKVNRCVLTVITIAIRQSP